jgi:hypothetical protein
MKNHRVFGSMILYIGISTFALLTVLVLASSFVLGAATYYNATFDFDTGSPVLAEGRGTPFTQTSGSVSASFSSPSDPAAFSVQSYGTTFYTLSQFSGKYLYDNNPSRDILDIKFNAELVGINFTFATIELHGASTDQTSNLLLTAYENTTLVSSTSAYGSFGNDSYPQGKLSYSSGEPFNWVRISMPAQASGATDFLVDNIIITFVSSPSTSPILTPTLTPAPSVPELPSSLTFLLIIVVATLVILISKMKRLKEIK